MKKLLCSLLVLMMLSLSACFDESVPLADGEKPLPDLSAEDFMNDDGSLRWPEEILPDGFPEPEGYEEINAVERIDNEVRVVFTSIYDVPTAEDSHEEKLSRVNPYSAYTDALAENEFVGYYDVNNGSSKSIRADGYSLVINTDGAGNEYLDPYAKKYNVFDENGGITVRGIVIEVIVKRTDDIPKGLFWKYPGSDADLGLEEIMFDEWPADHLPEGFPDANDAQRITVLGSHQNKTGLFIKVRGSMSDAKEYLELVLKSGFYQLTYQNSLLIADSGEHYIYVKEEWPEGSGWDKDMIYEFQICPVTEKVIK